MIGRGAKSDREVVPRSRPRYIGQERFYLREDMDAWTRDRCIAGCNRGRLEKKLRNDLRKNQQHQGRQG